MKTEEKIKSDFGVYTYGMEGILPHVEILQRRSIAEVNERLATILQAYRYQMYNDLENECATKLVNETTDIVLDVISGISALHEISNLYKKYINQK